MNSQDVRNIVIGCVLTIGMLLGTAVHCQAESAKVQTKCLDAGHDPTACDLMTVG